MIGLVSCAKGKRNGKFPARDLYISPLFVKASRYAEANYEAWFILSALHGLLDPNDRIDTYDMTLNDMSSSDRQRWAQQVLEQIEQRGLTSDRFAIHAGKSYRQYLAPQLDHIVPLEGLGIGQQLRWYQERGF